MPHQMQGLHAVMLQMMSNLLEVWGDCTLPQLLLPLLCELFAAETVSYLLGRQGTVHFESSS